LTTLLIKDIHTLVTMDAQRREITGGALFVRDGVIEYAGETAALPAADQTADEVLSLPKHLVMPGLVNTHHHMYQTLTRVIARTTNCSTGW